MPGEGDLALGISAGVTLSARDGILERKTSLEEIEQMRNAMRAHDGQRGIEAARAQRLRFLQRSSLDHLIEARVYSGAYGRSRRRDEKRRTTRRIQQWLGANPLKLRQRSSRGLEDLEGALDTLRIAVANPEAVSGSSLVSSHPIREVRVRAPTRATRARVSAGTAGTSDRPRQSRFKIEARAASDHRHASARLQFLQLGGERLEPATDRVVFRAIDGSKKSMRSELFFFQRRSRVRVSLSLGRLASNPR